MRNLILFSLLLSFGCQDSTPLFSSIKSCCEISSLETVVGTGKIYVPNLFTPNNDGINDNFTIFASSEIAQIKKLEVKKGSKTIFTATDFSPNSSTSAWDGTIDGEVVKGLFSFDIDIIDDAGITQSFSGKVCSLPCNGTDKDKKFDNFDNCTFGTQHNGAGGVDNNLMSFEVLECLE